MANNQNEVRALALVGMPGSGKTVCAKYLEAKGYYQFRFGGIVVGEVAHRGLALTPDNERVVREELRKNEGMDVMAKRALPLLTAALEEQSSIVIDGLYSFSEYKTLRKNLGVGMVVVAIFAPRHLRYERLTNRPVRPLTPDEAEERDWREIETIEKGGPIALADYTLVNDQDEETLMNKLDDLLDQLGLQP